MYQREEKSLPRFAFASAVSFSQLLGVGVVVMTAIWMGKYRGGYGWDGTERQFNYHPLFMIIGMVFLNAQGRKFLMITCTNYIDNSLYPLCNECLR